ncbi:MAG TPA: ATP-binding cassette domain-containing protein [Acidimicrobiales bacterium]|nr:ATP-binding cassette domain-containing protein [Acidimicrobiales bacterium]
MSHDTSAPIIEAVGLRKHFGEVEALAGLDLVAEPGRVLAVLGPNGAGKTTFVRTLATLVRPDAGELRVAGVDALRHPERVRRLIGLAGQYAAVEQAMTGRENLRMVARLFGHDRRRARAHADAVLEQLGLSEAADRLVRTYSGGMRRRLDLGASLVGAPRLLLLDEPTTGLDPRSRNELWDAIRALVATGTDVLLTTQYLDEADQLAHRIVIVDHGRVIADGTPGELKSLAGRDVVEVRARREADLPALVAALAPLGVGEPRTDAATNRVTVPVEIGRAAVAAAVRVLDDIAVEVDDIGLRRPTLDEVFLTLTGRPVDAPAGEPTETPDDETRGERDQLVASR